MYSVDCISVSELAQNCRVLADSSTSTAVVIDPGAEAAKIMNFLNKKGLKCTQIWLTHSHLDHCGGVQKVQQQTKATLFAHAEEAYLRSHVEEIAALYGISTEGEHGMLNCPEPEVFLKGGEILNFAGHEFQVLFTPGHSPGHVCFYDKQNDFLIAGDTLFAGSIGRTDLPMGSHKTLMQSLANKILTLPAETRVAPGHGPDTTIGQELSSNPFVSEALRSKILA